MESSKTKNKIVMIGDVGGSNVRLQLIRLYGPNLQEKDTLKERKKFNSQKMDSLISCVKEYLQDVPAEHYPKVCVIGMAGPVDNNTIQAVNIKHWGVTDGNQIARELGFQSFLFINDFTAAGYGVSRLTNRECTPLGNSGNVVPISEGSAGSVKVVIGPGTGLGQGILVKKDEVGGLYDPIPSEGGHSAFTVQTEEDWELVQFAKQFIENSNNIENRRSKGKVDRVSVERLCAGPAVPLIYSFMKQKYPYFDPVLEHDNDYGRPAKKFDDLEAADIISMGIDHDDPLCLKVIEKFTSIFGTETGNLALKTLPYGGIYLIGGVTGGIQQYLLNTSTFMDAFCDKGRLSNFMKEKFRVNFVDPTIEIGLLGAEEKARREVL